MFQSRTISVQIKRSLAEAYAFAHQPGNFMKWASGLATTLHREGDHWIADTPEGKARVRFSPPNFHGVLDHWVSLPNGQEIYIPLRLIANDDGCEVGLTLFRLSEMDDAAFERDGETVRQDLGVLKRLLET